MEWFRWYHGTVEDAKLTVIARRSGQSKPIVIAVWVALLEYTSSQDDRGSLEGFDCEVVAAALDIGIEQVEAVYQAMLSRGLVDSDRVTNWEKRQPKREDETGKERKERWKERQKEQPERSGTQPERSGTQPERLERARTEKNREEKNREEIKDVAVITTEENINSRTVAVFSGCFENHAADIKRLFPHADFEVERETCIAHYREGPPPTDPYPVVLKWFQRIPRPDGKGLRLTADELRRQQTLQAAREFAEGL